MRLWLSGLILVVAACSDVPDAPETGTHFKLYFLAGQSNMDGYGYTSELDPGEQGPVDNAYIFTGAGVLDGEPGGGLGLWARLQPGHGTGFTNDGVTNQLSDRFGAELSFGRTLARQSETPIALIKYSQGGTSLADDAGYGDWYLEGGGANDFNQYDYALETIRNAIMSRDIDGDGRLDTFEVAGIVWMQGESDAYTSAETAESYFTNLDRMMHLLRAALHRDDLPVVIGRITDSGMNEDGQVMPHIERVQQAQSDWVAQDACAAYVTEIDTYTHSDDAWHYDSAGYRDMGIAFANAMTTLETECAHSIP